MNKLEDSIREFLKTIDEISYDESWGYAIEEMTDEVNTKFVEAIYKLRKALIE